MFALLMFRLLTTASFFLSALSLGMVSNARAQELTGRAEVNWRYGTERSILMTEFWVPLAQDEGGVIYGDYRMMGDDQDNREFNAGLGYREIVTAPVLGKGVVGVHGWFDRRLTERGSNFNQVTLGAEWFSDDVDVLVNAYIPLNDDKTHTQENPNGTNPRLVGSQIIVNTDQLVVEETLSGMDLELGWNLPFLKDHTDSVRVYGGGYHFEGDEADNVSGWRTRLAADVTPDVQIGARFQRDNVRGSQGFFEATIRFPFGQKQSYRKKGLYARLDDSPERDIDIVSNEAIKDDGFGKPVVNLATGASQNIIHVNNTAAGGGDGSAKNPYNTLVAAEGAAGANDVIYVHRGDGTTTNMAAGITLDDVGQKLIGAGVNMTLSDLGLQTPNGLALSAGTTIFKADPLGNPTITNGAGDGVNVTADNVLVSGLTVDGTTRYGVYAQNTSGTSWNAVEIKNVNTQNNADEGIRIEVDGAGSAIQSTSVDNNISTSNTGAGAQGILTIAINNGTLNEVSITNNTSTSNQTNGIYILSQSGGDIPNINFSNNISQNNGGDGFRSEVRGLGSSISTATYTGNTAQNNTNYGFYSLARSSGTITTATYTGNTAQNNTDEGIRVESNGVGSIIQSATIHNNVSTSNTGTGNTHGILALATNSGSFSNIEVTSNTVTSNEINGIYLFSQSGGNIPNINFSNNTAQNNGNNGFLSEANGGGSLSVKLENSSFINNGNNGVFVNDDTTGTFNIDMGGGSLGSTGGNSIYGNTATDIWVDLDGAELKAENNWWGVNTGLAGGEVTLDGGSTIDADPSLTAAP